MSLILKEWNGRTARLWHTKASDEIHFCAFVFNLKRKWKVVNFPSTENLLLTYPKTEPGL